MTHEQQESKDTQISQLKKDLGTAELDSKLLRQEMKLRGEMLEEIRISNAKIEKISSTMEGVKVTGESTSALLANFIAEMRAANLRSEIDRNESAAERGKISAQIEGMGKRLTTVEKAARRRHKKTDNLLHAVLETLKELGSPRRLIPLMGALGVVWSGMGKAIAKLVPYMQKHTELDKYVEMTGVIALVVLILIAVRPVGSITEEKEEIDEKPVV